MYNKILGLAMLIAAFVLMILIYHFFGKQDLIAWVTISTIITNTRVIKTVEIFGISTTSGNAVFASIYLAAGMLNDIYGRRATRRAVWLDFPSALIMIIVMQSSLHFIPVPEGMAQKVLHTIFDAVPRIASGSIVVYITDQHIDALTSSLIKEIFSSDKAFFIHAYGSTFLNSIIDTVTFITIAFTGSLSSTVIFEIFTTTCVLKLTLTVLNVPFGYIARSSYCKGKIDKLDQSY